MEILIFGIILVALMAYASTKIKRTAAAAYEREVVETPRFSLVKPADFISPVDIPEGLLYAAYSKDFGYDEAEDMRRAFLELRILKNKDLDSARDDFAEAAERILDEYTEKIGGRIARVVSIERFENGVSITEFRKLISDDSGVYELRIPALTEYLDEYSERIDEIITGFRLN
jgi:hypothetical protein